MFSSTNIRPLPTSYNSDSRGSYSLFWPREAFKCTCLLTDTHACVHLTKNKHYIFLQKMGFKVGLFKFPKGFLRFFFLNSPFCQKVFVYGISIECSLAKEHNSFDRAEIITEI